MTFGIVAPQVDKLPGLAPLRNREPSTPPATFTNLLDESVFVKEGSALDMRAWRGTATPAGALGRITISGDKLQEAGVSRRFYIATIQPDTVFTPIPSDRATVDAAVKALARRGFNCCRVMGLELWVMAGQTGVAVFDQARIAALDYFLYALKREGIYWMFSTMGYNGFEDMQGAVSRFTYTEATNVKPRMYTEQTVRDNWALGVGRLYNRVNPHTGINMLADPACLGMEVFNEQSATFCASVQWPSRWLDRTPGSTAAAMTWGEWLADPAQAHGYANLAALNASWGTAFGSYALAAADAMPAMTNSLAANQKNIDCALYMTYLEDHLGAWYSAKLDEWGFGGIRSWHTMYSSSLETRATQKQAVNQLGNWHAYTAIAYSMTPGTPTTEADNPIWEYERAAIAAPVGSGTKPTWLGEAGWPSFGRWRQQFPITIAAMAANGVSASSWFTQGDFFAPSYYNDTSLHGDRIRLLDTWATPAAHANVMVDVMHAALLLRGDVSEMTGTQDIVLNDRYNGLSPRSPGRINRAFSTLFQPLQLLAALCKLRLKWTSDTTDDGLAATWNAKSWQTICQDMQTAGAIASDHPSLVSANANAGGIVSVATTGTVGGLTATQTEPVLDIGSNTLVDGDLIHVTNITGSVGTWPGTAQRNSRISVLKGTGNYVQLKADATRNVGGLALTGLSGANFTSGTWCEGANVLEAGNRQWGMSRRLKRAFINTSKTEFFSHTSATLPAAVGQMTVQALSTNGAVFVTSLDGLSIATSARLLIGMCGEAQNTGMTYTVNANGTITLTATGTYPIQQRDCTGTLSLALTRPQAWTLYRLARDGSRVSAETPAEIDADAGRLIVTLRTGTIQPTMLWELVRP